MGLALTCALLVCLGYSVFGKTSEFEHRCTLIALCVGFGTLLGALSIVCFLELFSGCDLLLEAFLIFLGVLNMGYATIDIWDDTVRRTDERSDAYQYAKLWPCCFPKCVGAIWLILSLASFVGIIIAVFYIAGGSTEEAQWYVYLPGPIVLGVAVLYALVTRCIPSLGGGGAPREGKPLLG